MDLTIRCAGAVIFDVRRRILMVQRAHEPDAGLWSIPGGRCLAEESSAAACVREVAEETGYDVRVVRFAGSVMRNVARGTGRSAGPAYAIDDYVCEVVGGSLVAGDDAADARWVSAHDMRHLALVPELTATLADWDLLPR